MLNITYTTCMLNITKYHMQSCNHQELSLLPQSDLIEHMKLNDAVENQTEGNICCFYQEIYRSYYTLFFQ